jgi:hypothetical protein
MKKIAGLGLLLPLFAITKAAPAQATALESNCTVSQVYFQPGNGGGNGGLEMLSVSCSDNSSYVLYVGPPQPMTTVACYGTEEGVKAMETIAMSARMSGTPVNIWYQNLNCPGASNIRVLTAIYM